jgi:hypothetical protein
MKKIIITTGSVTYATKAQRLLSKININSRLVKIDSNISSNGCTHGIEINYHDFMNAVGKLKENNIQFNVITV